MRIKSFRTVSNRLRGGASIKVNGREVKNPILRVLLLVVLRAIMMLLGAMFSPVILGLQFVRRAFNRKVIVEHADDLS